MMTLVELMAAKRADSYEKFAKRAGMSPAAAHKFGVGRNADMPPVDTVNSLARALDVPPSLVVLTAAHGLGIDMSDAIEGPALGRALPSDVDELPAYAKQAIIDNACALVAMMRGMAERPASLDDTVDADEVNDIAQAARRRLDRAANRSGKANNAKEL